MPQIAAYDDVKAMRKQREIPGGYAWRTNFMSASESERDAPVAFLAEGTARRVIRPHFHDTDQFQVIVSGGGVLGKHQLAMHAVHFSRARTPYGPIVAGAEGLGFLTLRPQWDRGAQYMPDSRDKLAAVPHRNPWQTTGLPDFSGSAAVNVHAFAEIRDERGLACYALSLKPHAAVAAPDPSTGNGQYIVVTKGSLEFMQKEYKAISIAFVKPHEAALQLVAGADGLEALVMNFPRHEPAAAQGTQASASPAYRVWQCVLCAFTYDEAKGMPDEGIAPGTRWEDVPESWACPDCSASKSDFQMNVVE